ncbi:MAG: carbon-nitrogen hydrolase family protein [Gammaproteobacteria bacterium]|nr:carbon-nitrogen hydrolase family protein [Gammaproteobacteria bacterium]
MDKVAAIQMASGPNVSANLTEAGKLISQAVDGGAKLVVLPENFAVMGITEKDKLKVAEQEGSGPIQDFLAGEAEKHGIWLVGGTIPIKTSDASRIRAASLVFNDKGKPAARYDKIHLFDVTLEESGETYHESETIEHGDSITVTDTPFGRLGIAVCYDLRFPEMFRSMADQNVEIIAVPSAFTAITGKAHWETLVRARAIENLAYVVASAQGGYHVSGRETYGNSMIVDPWGTIQDCLPRGSGVVLGELDMQKIQNTRRSFPVLEHRRMLCSPSNA